MGINTNNFLPVGEKPDIVYRLQMKIISKKGRNKKPQETKKIIQIDDR